MSQVRVHTFSISLDGYGAGPEQSQRDPLGKGGEAMHEWFFPTETFQKLYGKGEGTTGIEDVFAKQGFENIGAWVMGRNMFGPIRGPWPDERWKGWWGEEPPYHTPVFVLSHHPRAPLSMKGGTTFHFVNGSVEEVIARARQAAGGKDVRVGGGVSVVRQCLQARLIDRMHLAISPMLLGSGEHLLYGLDLLALGYRVTEHVHTEAAMHVVIERGSLDG